MEVSVQEPHPLGPVEEMTLARRILQEMCCRERIDLVTGADSWGEANEEWRAGATPTNAGRPGSVGAARTSPNPPRWLHRHPNYQHALGSFIFAQQTEAAGGLGKSLLSKPFPT